MSPGIDDAVLRRLYLFGIVLEEGQDDQAYINRSEGSDDDQVKARVPLPFQGTDGKGDGYCFFCALCCFLR